MPEDSPPPANPQSVPFLPSPSISPSRHIHILPFKLRCGFAVGKRCSGPSPHPSGVGSGPNRWAELGAGVGSAHLGLLAPLGSSSPSGRSSCPHQTDCGEGAFAAGVRWKAHSPFVSRPIPVTEAISWRGGALWGTPRACRNPGVDFSNTQTICQQLQRWERGRGVPWSPPLLACSHGSLQCPRALPKSSAFAGPAARGHAAGLARWGQRCLKVGDLQDSSAKPNSPCAGGHSRPVCPSARAAVVPPAPHALRLETWRNFL